MDLTFDDVADASTLRIGAFSAQDAATASLSYRVTGSTNGQVLVVDVAAAVDVVGMGNIASLAPSASNTNPRL